MATSAWRAGQWRPVGEHAKRALAGAVACRDRHHEARASLLLAQVLTLESRFQWAHRFASRARQLFAEDHDTAALFDSSLALSYVESALGRQEQAMRIAADAITGAGLSSRGAAGLNYRGIAAFWNSDYGTARRVLRAACELAPEHAGGRAGLFQPLTNAVCNEVLRCAHARIAGHRTDLSELEALVARAWELVNDGAIGSVATSFTGAGLLLLEFASCFLATRSGETEKADRHYLACLTRAAQLPAGSWMHGLVWWARLERTLATGDASQVHASLEGLTRAAAAGEHAPMKQLAERLCAEAQSHLARLPSPAATWF